MAAALTSNAPVLRVLRRVHPQVDAQVARFFGGRTLAGLSTGLPVVFVHAIGAKTGRTRTVPLLVVPYSGGVLAIGSNYGLATNPGWVHNLRANPDVTASMRGVEARVHARELRGAERAEAFAMAVALFPGWGSHQRRAAPRVLPVFHIVPR